MAKHLRCAIYTRKSSEEGLEQGFNSLHAQREACEAFVLSQAGEGWSALKTPYDDGGFSGGSMDRPALKALLADIASGLVDVVVVYKVDRLTRSLTDFARIVEAFDKAGVSFVSVTQAFNTTTSMGRLTLNVLLSFAQFEREVTGERIRDKIAASKKKGMWMGGVPPLGYDLPTDLLTRALVVNEEQAATVRLIFAKYLETGSVHDLTTWLAAQGVRSKAWVSAKGRKMGGLPINRGALFHLLRNRVYLGEITHKGQSHPGAHAAIVDEALFGEVQARLDAQVRRHRGRPRRVSTMALKGLIFDAQGDAMNPTFTHGAKGRVHRYYVSSPLQQGRRPPADGTIRRVPAQAVEDLVTGCLRRLLGSKPSALGDYLARVEVHPTTVQLVAHRRAFFTMASDAQSQIETLAAKLRAGERIAAERQVDWARCNTPNGPSGADPAQTAEWCITPSVQAGAQADGAGPGCNTRSDDVLALLRITLPCRLKFQGGAVRITGADGRDAVGKTKPDAALIRGLRSAHGFLTKCNTPLARAEHLGVESTPKNPYHRDLCRLAFLAPDIQQLILEGKQPADMSLAALLRADLPIVWADQRAMFDIPC